jgi:hypothetical protein
MTMPHKSKLLPDPFWALVLMVVCLSFVSASTAIGAEPPGIPIIVENSSKEAAEAAPVSAGIPFARKTLTDVKTLALSGSDGQAVPLQAQYLSKWTDGSCRWVLADFQASVAAGGRSEFILLAGGEQLSVTAPVKVTFDNGTVKFNIVKGSAFASLSSSDAKAGAKITSAVVIGPKDKPITSKTVVDSLEVYAKGPLRAAVSISGRRIYSDGRDGPDPRNYSKEFMDATVENCRKVIDAVKPKRAKFTLEMMPWAIPDGPDNNLQLIKAVDRTAFGVHVDVCNMVNTADRFLRNAVLIEDCFKKLGKWIVSCHAKDLKGEKVESADPALFKAGWKLRPVVETVPGRGTMDYRAYLRAIADYAPGAPLLLEHLSTAKEYDEGRNYIVRVATSVGLSFS